MAELHNQTTAYITPTYNSSRIYHQDANLSQSTNCEFRIDLKTASVVFFLSFLGLCFTVYGLYSSFKTDHFVSVYIRNLFICNLIQTSAALIEMSVIIYYTQGEQCNYVLSNIFNTIYNIGVVMNICFMVCISADRFVMIAYPVRYRNSNRTRVPVFVSVTIWTIFAVLATIIYICFHEYIPLGAVLVFIVPYPLVIVFLVGTWRTLARNSTTSPKEQRRIMAPMVLVLIIYTFVFLPCIIKWIFCMSPCRYNGIAFHYYVDVADTVLTLNPIFDFLLYLGLRRDAKDILTYLFFCFHKKHEENSVMTEV